MKFKFATIPLVSLMAISVSQADTFVLKNGDRLDAKILKETEDSYVLDVKVTKSIRDEKTIAKADVAEIIAEKVDETAFAKIKDLGTVPDLTPAVEYENRIKQVSKFIKDHPGSPLIKDAEGILAGLKSEAAIVAAGGMKQGGKILSAEEYKQDAYDIDAKIIEKRVKDAVAREDLVGALRGIYRLEQIYAFTNSRRAVAPIKAQVLRSYKAVIDSQIANFEARSAQRKLELSRMSGDSRAAVERANEEEVQALKKANEADRNSRQIWLHTNEFDIDSLTDAQEVIEDQISETFTDNGRDSGKIFRNVYRIIGEQSDPNVLQEVVYKAEEVSIRDKYLDILKELAKAKGATF